MRRVCCWWYGIPRAKREYEKKEPKCLFPVERMAILYCNAGGFHGNGRGKERKGKGEIVEGSENGWLTGVSAMMASCPDRRGCSRSQEVLVEEVYNAVGNGGSLKGITDGMEIAGGDT